MANSYHIVVLCLSVAAVVVMVDATTATSSAAEEHGDGRCRCVCPRLSALLGWMGSWVPSHCGGFNFQSVFTSLPVTLKNSMVLLFRVLEPELSGNYSIFSKIDYSSPGSMKRIVFIVMSRYWYWK